MNTLLILFGIFHDGHFNLKFNGNNKHCLMVANSASLVFGKWGNNGITFYRNSNYIISSLYEDKCITLNNNNSLVIIDCNESNSLLLK